MTIPEGKPSSGATPSRGAPLGLWETLLPGMLEAMSEAVVVFDPHGRVIAANTRFAEVFGAGDPVPGRGCANPGACPIATPPTETDCITCAMLHAEAPLQRRHTRTDANGRTHRWEATITPLRDESGALQALLEVWRDVSDRTMLEAQLAHSEHLAKLGLLAAGVAHELNNPLGALRIGVEALQRLSTRVQLPVAEAEYLNEMLKDMEHSTQRCIETSRKLRMLGDQQTSRPDWVNLNVVASETLDLLRYAALKQGIQMHRELAEDLPPIWGNGGPLRGAMMHLCFNAVQAMPQGGNLTVRTRLAGERVVLVIQDDGPGIPAEHLPRLWDPFFTTKPVGQGTGLGLSITRRTVLDHGGDIEVASTPGAGACFTLTLPIGSAGGDRV